MPDEQLDKAWKAISHPLFVKASAQERRDLLATVLQKDTIRNMTNEATHRLVIGIAAKHSGTQPYPAPGLSMDTSAEPAAARAGAEALPIVGGIGGAMAAAPFPGGAVVGGMAGAGGGEMLKQAILNRSFDEGPSPFSAEGLKKTGTTAAIAGVAELPAVFLSGGGRMVLNRLANAKSGKEVGDAIAAIESLGAKNITSKGLLSSLDATSNKIGNNLGAELANTKGYVDINILASPYKAASRAEDAAIAAEVGKKSAAVTDAVNRSIALAKSEAGITGQNATAQQLEKFRKIIANKAFSAKVDYPTVSNSVQRILQDLSSDSSSAIKMLARQANPGSKVGAMYEQLSDIYAAKNAIGKYRPGKMELAAVAAATNPKTTAGLIPIAEAAAYFGGRPAINQAKKLIP